MGLASPQGMRHVFRFLGVCLAVLLLAARVEAAAEGHDLAGARRAAVGMEELLADTLGAMRSVA